MIGKSTPIFKMGEKLILGILGSTEHAGSKAFHAHGLSKYFEQIEYFPTLEALQSNPSKEEINSIFVADKNQELFVNILDYCPNVKWVHTEMVGVDNVLCEQIVNSNIVLTNPKGAYSESLAEFILYGILHFTKRMPLLNQQKKDHIWNKVTVGWGRGQTIGIVGYGDIGRVTARLLKASLQTRILALKRNLQYGILPEDELLTDQLMGPEGLDYLLSESDFVIGILPLTPHTKHFFDLGKFRKMKKGGVFMNIGRGPTVKEEDLIVALNTQVIHGACLDVFEVEPLPKESPLYELDNLILTPHCADVTPDYFDLTVLIYEKEIINATKGLPFINVIDKLSGY